MAVSTCEGSIAPEEQAAPVETAKPLQVERDHQRFAFDVVEINVGGVRHAGRAFAIYASGFDFGQNSFFQTIAHGGHLCQIAALQCFA